MLCSTGCHCGLEHLPGSLRAPSGTRDPTAAAEPGVQVSPKAKGQLRKPEGADWGWLLYSLLVQLFSVSFVITGWAKVQLAVSHMNLFVCSLVCCH